MAAGGELYRAATGRLIIRVRLTPKSSADRIEGVEMTAEGPALKARVRAAPQDGEANAALERLIADWLDVPRRTVEVERGGKSRVKTVAVTGDAAALAPRVGERLKSQS
ncbi:MAG TPA: DUF167 domain-containing protein [Hyphomicrobiaceae bacterium]|nr:DUF167 domain-containing protein [Hyphomicrobiaceae bacterium]